MRIVKTVVFFICINHIALSYANYEDNCFRTAPLPIESFPYFGSPTPSEGFDSQRTHLFPYACTAQELLDKQYQLNYRKLEGFAKPYNVVTRNRDELYLYGGSQADADSAPPNPYIAKIDANHLQEKWRVYLRQDNESIDWNYSGATAIHSNGNVYVIYSNYLKKIDPNSGKILASLTLPATDNDPSNSTYNGFVFDEAGHIIAKSINRSSPCFADGFKAFTKCPSTKPSMLLHIDAKDLKILDQVLLPENVVGRIAASNNYVYFPGLHLFRYKISETQGLNFDKQWGMVSYRSGEQAVGTSPTFLNVDNEEYVIIENNMLASKDPISIYAINTHNSAIKTFIQPFTKKKYNLFSQQISLPSVDKENQMLFAADARYGELAGIQLEKGPRLTIKWKKAIRTFDFTILVGDANNRELITTDLIIHKNKIYSNLQWLDAKTGDFVEKSSYVPAGPGLALSVGYNSRFYQLGYDGALNEWQFR